MDQSLGIGILLLKFILAWEKLGTQSAKHCLWNMQQVGELDTVFEKNMINFLPSNFFSTKIRWSIIKIEGKVDWAKGRPM